MTRFRALYHVTWFMSHDSYDSVILTSREHHLVNFNLKTFISEDDSEVDVPDIIAPPKFIGTDNQLPRSVLTSFDLAWPILSAFVASIDTNFKIENTIVPFNKVELNSGSALSKDGTFTAPSGIFHPRTDFDLF